MPKQKTYNDIYLDIFENYDVGLVEILGPTGNGKTSALYKDFNNEDRFILNQIAKAKQQAIFMTDRKNIVKEVAHACEKQGIKHVYYRANHEIIKKIVLRKKGINTLLSQVGDLSLFGYMRFHTERSIRELFAKIHKKVQTGRNEKDLYKEINEDCNEILKAFRGAISKKIKSLPETSPKIEELLNSPAVWELFPLIEFTQDTSKVVLIGTTTKLGYPMFDGENHRSIYELKGYYLFIDEFDRQVDAFLDHLIDDKKNLHPEIFVSHFCEHYAGKSGEYETTQKGIAIAEEFHNTMSEMGLQFPRGKTDNYKFSNADHLFKRNKQDNQPFGYIFDSGYTVSSDMYYLRDNFSTPYEGELVFTKDDGSASFIEFYETIRRFEIKIFNFFADLKRGKKVKEDSYRNLLRLIYDIKNDEEITAYHKFIDQNSPAFRPRSFDFLRDILDQVEQHYLSKKYQTPEELIAEWDLPTHLKQIHLQDEQTVLVNWHNHLVIYQGGLSTTLALPNMKDLPTHWTIYLLAFDHSLTISPSEGYQLNAYTKFINDYTLNKGEVVKIRKHLQQKNTFQILKRFPILRRLDCDDSFFTRSYAYNQIIDRHSPDSENRVDVNHYSLKMTPEARLFMLAARNLVFGISATSDIQQNYAHFSLPWVRTALTVFSQSQQVQTEEKPLRVCIPDTGSRSKYDPIIASMLETKEKTRQTQLSGPVRNACGLDEQDEWAARILQGLEELRGNGVDLYGDKNVSEGKKDRRLSRVSYHFEAFRWILEKSQNDTHLIFTDTFSNTLKIFQYTVAHAEGSDECPTGFTAFLDCLQSKDKQAIKIEPVKSSDNDLQPSNAIETVFLFKLNRLEQNNPQKSAYIIFANAATWGKIYDDNKAFYNEIFNRGCEENRKVIVITQHASASNGVNLQYELKRTQKDGTTEIVERDFESFYMSHPLYYFFASNDDDDKEPRKPRKRETAEDIRNKEKSLYKASKFKVNHVIGISHLKKFMGGSSELNFEYLNGAYRKTEDYRKYMIMLLTQEIGRVERTRDKAKPTEVTLPENMRYLIEKVDSDSALSRTLFENRQPRMSPLLKAIINDIRETAVEKHYRNEDEYESIGKMTVRYKEQMKKLIEFEFNQLRKGFLSEKNAKSLRHLWEEMREAALKSDFHFQWNRYFEFEFMEHCVFNTCHISQNESGEAQIFIRREHGNEDILPEWQAGVYTYQPNKIYEVVRENVVIGNHFAYKGFKERFDFTYQEDNWVFIPEFQKAILQGAIGEEALKALLREAGIEIESNENIPDELFELVDFKIKDLPIYVDAKHWKDDIIEDFANEEGESVSQKLTQEEYMKKGRNILSAIQRVTGVSHAKVVYINLLFSEGKGYVQKTGYRNQDCTKPVATWEDASFVYIAGALSRQKKNKHHDIFDHFLNDVWQELERLENPESSEKDNDRLSENLITNQVSSTNLVFGNDSTEKDDYASTQDKTDSVHHQYHLFNLKEQ